MPFATSTGLAGVECQFLAVTVTALLSCIGVEAVAVTLTVPVATMTPDQLIFVEFDVTAAFVPSENFHPETVVPLGPVTVQVVLCPLVMGYVQDNATTLVGPFGLSVRVGQAP